jgi:hypothetical protein
MAAASRMLLVLLRLKAARQPRGCGASSSGWVTPVICIDSRRTKAVLKMQINKSDTFHIALAPAARPDPLLAVRTSMWLKGAAPGTRT